ncbi:roadblock/LC7 domain-containing protein [Rivularia sp. UHCC 0363]|uniref:roadblock/LC7 domain-containing protein n=1 Tax=Rivularia sp. UHCC 0363 TaxID=3110244 RepID=UPI002B221778|nr:roadblock/LC7 domain-containing protein [Rivularia sp. UHCC 0363]MEA5592804.1 roadblock/LC7 domain-containing protein [Rivularia sp. UHCC 0363]
MPLGKIIKLLKGAFHKHPAESVDSLELPETENNLSMTSEENTGLVKTNVGENTLEQPSAEITQTSLPTILEEKKMINVSMLQDELQNFVSAASEVQGAALVSPDGLALASVLPGGMDEERTAAMSASMLSLGERIGRELARGSIDRIVVEGEKGYGVLVGCGADAVLLVLAGAGVKQGLLFLEVKRVVAKIAPLMG